MKRCDHCDAHGVPGRIAQARAEGYAAGLEAAADEARAWPGDFDSIGLARAIHSLAGSANPYAALPAPDPERDAAFERAVQSRAHVTKALGLLARAVSDLEADVGEGALSLDCVREAIEALKPKSWGPEGPLGHDGVRKCDCSGCAALRGGQ
jgi:hypothetical protein